MNRLAEAAAWTVLALLLVAFPLLREQSSLFASTSGVRPLAGACELAVVLAAALAGALRALAGPGGAAVFGVLVVLAISLVDGSLYHVGSLIRAACLVAVAAGSTPRVDEVRIGPSLAFAVAVGSALVLGLHATVLALQRGPIPAPGDPAVAIVRRFPSNVDRVYRWGTEWAKEDPETAVAWLHWGHDRARSKKAWKFYFLEGCILRAGDFQKRAVAHLEHALRLAPRRADRALILPWLAYARGEGERPSAPSDDSPGEDS